ncbi:MAG: 1-acyl-sn-glycerol-3-phosphate acyltransferase, partial [Chitinophagales bacterium]
MDSFFLKIHDFLGKKPFVFYLLILATMSLGAFSMLNLDLEEDIKSVLPKNDDMAEIDAILNDLSSPNQVIFLLKDETKSSANLKTKAQEISVQLLEKIDSNLIENITFKTEDDAFLDLLENIYTELPAYLTAEDYTVLDEKIEEEILRKNLQKKFKVLFTPAGSMFKSSIVNDPLDLSMLALARMQSLQVDDNYALDEGYLISKDEQYLIGFLELTDDINKAKSKEELTTIVKDILAENNENSPTQVSVFGSPIIAQENASRIKNDIMLTVNIAVAVMMLLIAFYFRSIKILPGILLPILLGSAVALFILYCRQTAISAISLGMGSVLLGTVIDYSLHIFTHFRADGDSKKVIKHTATPIMIGCITTTLAFLSLTLTGSKALIDLAIFAAGSMFFGAIFSLIILPFLFRNTFKGEKKIKPNFIDKIAAIPYHKKKGLVASIIVIFVVSLFFIRNISFTKDLNELNYMPDYLLEAEQELNNSSTAIASSLFVIHKSTSLEEGLQRNTDIENLANSLQQEGKIKSIHTPSSVLISQNEKTSRNDLWLDYWTVEKREYVQKIIIEEAQKTGISAKAFDDFFATMEEPSAEEKSTSLDDFPFLKSFVKEENGKYTFTIIIKSEKEHKPYISEKIKEIDSSIIVFDRANMASGLITQVQQSLKYISLILIVLMFVILYIHFRRIELVIITFMPVLFSWLFTLGLMGLLHISFNMLNIVVVIFVFGLGIDYAVFIMSGLVADYRNNTRKLGIYKSSVLLSSITTFVGIGVLIFAKHPALYSIAAAGMIAIFSVFIFSVVLMPAIFNFMVFNRVKHKMKPLVVKSFLFTLMSYGMLLFGVIILSIYGLFLHATIWKNVQKKRDKFHTTFQYWAQMYLKGMYPNQIYTFVNDVKEDFSKPSIIIANHQSLIDTPIMVALSPKILILTKDWVRKSPVFGIVANLAEFYSVDDGQEEVIKQIKKKLDDGFSIVVFPEGSRSDSLKVKRFHRGAFYMAHKFEMDIVPISICGSIETLHRDQFWGHFHPMTVQIHERIKFEDKSHGETHLERYKSIRKTFKANHLDIRKEVENGDYHYNKIVSGYVYKSEKD